MQVTNSPLCVAPFLTSRPSGLVGSWMKVEITSKATQETT